MKVELTRYGQIIFHPNTGLEEYAIKKIIEDLKNGCDSAIVRQATED